MTKTKPQPFASDAGIRNPAGVVAIPEGTYSIRITRHSGTIQKAVEDGSADFFVMGMVIPAHKAPAVSQILHDSAGQMPSPVLLLKNRKEDEAACEVPRVSAVSEFSAIPLRVENEMPVLRIKDIEINTGKHEVKVKGRKVNLTFSEFRILQTLASKPGWVFDRDKIIRAVHGENYNCTARAVDVQVTGLRKKLGPAGSSIETVRGVGYRFVD